MAILARVTDLTVNSREIKADLLIDEGDEELAVLIPTLGPGNPLEFELVPIDPRVPPSGPITAELVDMTVSSDEIEVDSIPSTSPPSNRPLSSVREAGLVWHHKERLPSVISVSLVIEGGVEDLMQLIPDWGRKLLKFELVHLA